METIYQKNISHKEMNADWIRDIPIDWETRKLKYISEIDTCGLFGNEYSGGYRDWETDRKSTRLNSSHRSLSRMPSSA